MVISSGQREYWADVSIRLLASGTSLPAISNGATSHHYDDWIDISPKRVEKRRFYRHVLLMCHRLFFEIVRLIEIGNQPGLLRLPSQ
jgi:hypothetical protein